MRGSTRLKPWHTNQLLFPIVDVHHRSLDTPQGPIRVSRTEFLTLPPTALTYSWTKPSRTPRWLFPAQISSVIQLEAARARFPTTSFSKPRQS